MEITIGNYKLRVIKIKKLLRILERSLLIISKTSCTIWMNSNTVGNISFGITMDNLEDIRFRKNK